MRLEVRQEDASVLAVDHIRDQEGLLSSWGQEGTLPPEVEGVEPRQAWALVDRGLGERREQSWIVQGLDPGLKRNLDLAERQVLVDQLVHLPGMKELLRGGFSRLL